jgi:ABC-type multidrug transport system fused ATPase/permease subunit
MRSQAETVSQFGVDSMAFQLAVGEKISSVITILSMLVTALGLSFYLGWILTLVLLGTLPIIGLSWANNIQRRNKVRRQH